MSLLSDVTLKPALPIPASAVPFVAAIVASVAAAYGVRIFLVPEGSAVLRGAALVALVAAPSLALWFASPIVATNKQFGSNFVLAANEAELVAKLHPLASIFSVLAPLSFVRGVDFCLAEVNKNDVKDPSATVRKNSASKCHQGVIQNLYLIKISVFCWFLFLKVFPHLIVHEDHVIYINMYIFVEKFIVCVCVCVDSLYVCYWFQQNVKFKENWNHSIFQCLVRFSILI